MIPDQTSSMSPIIHAQAKLAFKSAVDSAGFMFQQKQQLLVSFLQRKMFYKITIPKFQKLSLTMKHANNEAQHIRMNGDENDSTITAFRAPFKLVLRLQWVGFQRTGH